MATHTNILLESGTNELEIIEFHIDETLPTGEQYTGYYGINVAKVLEIIRVPSVTGLPNARHTAVMGAFNLRNRVIPLVNLAVWLGKNMIETNNAKVVVTEFNQVINAFLVSGVTRIHRLSWEQIEPPNAHIQSLSHDSITGMVKMENRVVFLLDMEKIIGELNPELFFKGDADSAAFAAAKGPIDYKVLISDDSTSVRNLIGTMLEKCGFEVTRTINGKLAWDELEKLKRQAEAEGRDIRQYVNLVVSDIEMPVMDGHNLTMRIKNDPVLKVLPVILFSSLITDGLRHKGEAVGANEQISKPDLPILATRAKELVDEFMAK